MATGATVSMRNRLPVLPVVAIVAAIVVIIAIAVGVRSCAAGASHSAVDEVTAAVNVTKGTEGFRNQIATASRDVTASDLLSIPGSADIAALNLAGGPVATLPDEALSAVRGYVADIEASQVDGTCGFVFVDMGTGRGIAYNADEAMYVASAAKAPFAYYLLANGLVGDEGEREEVAFAIVDSDNDSFEDLAAKYMGDGYAGWMAEHDVRHEDYWYDFYPPMSARSLAAIWGDILAYIRGGSQDAQWLASLLASTDTSFIRDGLPWESTTVENKAGWIGEQGKLSEKVYESVTDAAIVEADSGTYLMVIVTNQYDSGNAEARVSALASALYDLRDAM